jgi:hypothetical protein
MLCIGFFLGVYAVIFCTLGIVAWQIFAYAILSKAEGFILTDRRILVCHLFGVWCFERAQVVLPSTSRVGMEVTTGLASVRIRRKTEDLLEWEAPIWKTGKKRRGEFEFVSQSECDHVRKLLEAGDIPTNVEMT